MTVSSPERTRPAWALATFFGAGYFPKGPGTAGSVAAILIAWPLMLAGFTPPAFAVLAMAALWPAIWASGVVATEAGRKDPQIVVVDEVLGQWLTLAGAMRLNWRCLLLALALFRFFDILKPPPVRRFERIPGGAGIVLDDMMAGLYGAVVLFGLGWFNLY
ncbi:MAG: phosphatidylglycerophosphatase A [Acidobacteriota bacterium]